MPEDQKRMTGEELRAVGYDPFFDPVAMQRAMETESPAAKTQRRRPKKQPKARKKDASLEELKGKFEAAQKGPDLSGYLTGANMAIPVGGDIRAPWEETFRNIVSGGRQMVPAALLPKETIGQWQQSLPSQYPVPLGVYPSDIPTPEERLMMAELFYKGYRERFPDTGPFQAVTPQKP